MSFASTKSRMHVAGAAIAFSLLAIVWVPAVAAEEGGQPVRLSQPQFDRLFEHLHVKNQLWASIPWQTSVTEARKKAAREKKPIFFNVNTGNALGFT